MAKGNITTYTSDEGTNIQLGQLGSAILRGSDLGDDITPPTGCVIVAIQVIEANTRIDNLDSEDDSRFVNSNAAAHDSTTHAEDSLHGTGGETWDTTVYLFSGFAMYGRWTSVSISAGAIIAYFGK